MRTADGRGVAPPRRRPLGDSSPYSPRRMHADRPGRTASHAISRAVFTTPDDELEAAVAEAGLEAHRRGEPGRAQLAERLVRLDPARAVTDTKAQRACDDVGRRRRVVAVVLVHGGRFRVDHRARIVPTRRTRVVGRPASLVCRRREAVRTPYYPARRTRCRRMAAVAAPASTRPQP